MNGKPTNAEDVGLRITLVEQNSRIIRSNESPQDDREPNALASGYMWENEARSYRAQQQKFSGLSACSDEFINDRYKF